MMCTYLYPSEGKAPTGNATLDTLIQEVRERTGDDWRVMERKVVGPRRGLLRRREMESCYELFVGTGSGIEFQVINFWQPWKWSINPVVRPELVIAYLYGVLSYPSSPKVEEKGVQVCEKCNGTFIYGLHNCLVDRVAELMTPPSLRPPEEG